MTQDKDEAFARWMADTNAPALRRMDAEGAHAAGYAAGAAAERERCAIAAWIHYMDVCKARGLAPSEHEHWNAARAVRGHGAQYMPPRAAKEQR